MADLTIQKLGHRGDGIAYVDGRAIFVGGALPGEVVRGAVIGERADDVTIVTPSPDRVEPPCPHFGNCGGCVLQHVASPAYASFKRQMVIEALADRGITTEVGDTILVPPASRRRATFAGIMDGSQPLVGFHQKASAEIVAVPECQVVTPRLLKALHALEALTALIRPRKDPLDLTVTDSDSGADVAISGVSDKDIERLRMALIETAGRFDLARLAVNGETIVQRRAPMVTIDGLAVIPGPGGFLQASVAAEEAMAGLVVTALKKAKRVADLYAGVGTFALRLARQSEITAAESDAGAIAALDGAARLSQGRKRIKVERRDLARRPYVEKELAGFDGVVFDPPRAGAAEQSAFLARSDVPVVVAVSCNPATLARDLRLLIDGGYALQSVTPVDQFLWSSHIEVVAVLTKKRTVRR